MSGRGGRKAAGKGRVKRGAVVHFAGWTKETPTVPGYYWFRDDLNEPMVVKIFADRTTGALNVIHGPYGSPYLIEYAAEKSTEWIGPLKPEDCRKAGGS